MQQIKLTDSYLEGQLIQALLAQPNKVVQYLEDLTPSHFADHVYRDIFDAIHICIMSSLRPDIINVSQVIASATRDKARKDAAIDAVRSSVGTSIPTGVPALISRLNALRLGRDIHQVIAEAGEMLHDLNPATLDTLTDRVMKLNLKQGGGENVADAPEAADKALAALNEAIEAAKNGVLPPSVVYTGFNQFDKVCGGLRAGEVVGIGGAQGDGKSSLIRQICLNAALSGHPVLLYSGEMDEKQVALLMCCTLSAMASPNGRGINNREIFSGEIYKESTAYAAYLNAVEVFQSLPITIVHSISDYRAVMGNYKRWRIKHKDTIKPPMFAVDYIGLLTQNGSRNKHEMIADISKSIKQSALSDNTLMLVGTQLNREKLKRGGLGIPRKGDSSDSKGLEDDATILAYLHSPAEFSETDETGFMYDKTRDRDLYVVKARFGGLGKFNLWCDMASGIMMQREEAQNKRYFIPMPTGAFMGGGLSYG